jgi:hypothetical protein
VRRSGNEGGSGDKDEKWTGESGGSAIRREFCGQEGVVTRCLLIVRMTCANVRWNNYDSPLHECDANLGVRRYTNSTFTNTFWKVISVLRGTFPDGGVGRETAADPNSTPGQQ